MSEFLHHVVAKRERSVRPQMEDSIFRSLLNDVIRQNIERQLANREQEIQRARLAGYATLTFPVVGMDGRLGSALETVVL